MVLKANKYCLYPSDRQKELLDKHFGCVRLVFNLALQTKIWSYSANKTNLSRYDLQVQLKDLKEDYSWLREFNSQSLQAALHEKITNQRKDFLHKVTDVITRHYDTVCIEDLTVSNMIKNRILSQTISDAGWGIFGVLLKYKAAWRGINILEIGKFEPSSKLHNGCGYIHKDLTLKDRQWTCPGCGKVVNRDVNAAITCFPQPMIKSSESLAG